LIAQAQAGTVDAVVMFASHRRDRRGVRGALLDLCVLAGGLAGVWWALASYNSAPRQCAIESHRCVGDVLGATLVPFVLRTAGGLAIGLVLGAFLVAAVRRPDRPAS
jgi:hypothetical protein